MSVEAIHVQIIREGAEWRMGVGVVVTGGHVIPYVGNTHERTRRRYPTPSDAITSSRHLVNDIMATPPAGVPQGDVPADRWNRDGDVPSDKLTNGGGR